QPAVVEGHNLHNDSPRVFGGQILAQVLTAAADASPDKSVKSLHILFPREGDTSKPMRYRGANQQDGRPFAQPVRPGSSGGGALPRSARPSPGTRRCSLTPPTSR